MPADFSQARLSLASAVDGDGPFLIFWLPTCNLYSTFHGLNLY